MLVRFNETTSAPYRIGYRIHETIYDISSRYPSVKDFVAAHPDGWSDADIDVGGMPSFPAKAVHIGAPVDDGATVFLVGANYKLHAEEAGLDVPDSPCIFTKPTTALVGPSDPICLPPVSSEMDYEGELAVMIGRAARRVSAADAPKYVAGLTVVNDVTARDLQWMMLGKNRIVDWLSSKGLDNSTPVGPGIVSRTAVADPHKLHLTTDLNDQRMQDGETSLMVFNIWQLIEFLSARVTLRPGDILSTGTPVGVGGFRKIFLKPGDRLRVEIRGIGVIDNPVIKD